MPLAGPSLSAMNKRRTYRECDLARRLGMGRLADAIAKKYGPWIFLTPKGIWALEAAGLIPKREPDPGAPVRLGIYR